MLSILPPNTTGCSQSQPTVVISFVYKINTSISLRVFSYWIQNRLWFAKFTQIATQIFRMYFVPHKHLVRRARVQNPVCRKNPSKTYDFIYLLTVVLSFYFRFAFRATAASSKHFDECLLNAIGDDGGREWPMVVEKQKSHNFSEFSLLWPWDQRILRHPPLKPISSRSEKSFPSIGESLNIDSSLTCKPSAVISKPIEYQPFCLPALIRLRFIGRLLMNHWVINITTLWLWRFCSSHHPRWIDR